MDADIFTDARYRIGSSFYSSGWEDNVGKIFEDSLMPEMLHSLEQLHDTADEFELLKKQIDEEFPEDGLPIKTYTLRKGK